MWKRPDVLFVSAVPCSAPASAAPAFSLCIPFTCREESFSLRGAVFPRASSAASRSFFDAEESFSRNEIPKTVLLGIGTRGGHRKQIPGVRRVTEMYVFFPALPRVLV